MTQGDWDCEERSNWSQDQGEERSEVTAPHGRAKTLSGSITLEAQLQFTLIHPELQLYPVPFSVAPSFPRVLKNHTAFILCRPLLPPSVFPSIRVFSNESVLRIRWPKYWSFSFSISPSNEYSGLISFRMDWLDLLTVQGTLKSLLQHHSSKASILRLSAFFTVQLSLAQW